MNLSQKIIEGIKVLPEIKQVEVLDFIEYLKSKTEEEENRAWSDLSLSSAMKGLESDEMLYFQADIKEYFNDS